MSNQRRVVFSVLRRRVHLFYPGKQIPVLDTSAIESITLTGKDSVTLLSIVSHQKPVR
jgi:hypothetical protein